MENEKILTRAANRRNFLKGAGLTGLGLAGAAMIGSKFGASEQKVEAASLNDADILNFALNLEYLEAEFYSMALKGQTLVQLGVLKESDQTGPTTGGSMVPNLQASPEGLMATGLYTNEIQHVNYLRAALGSGAVKKPAINLDALGYGFANVNSWLELARQFEDVGVSAYLGAAPFITSKTYLSAAGAILSTEARHSGSIRFACIMYGVTSPAVDSLDIPPTRQKPYGLDSHGLSIPRTTSEVLNIVYGGGKSSGGFYPQGMNGTISSQ
jgi:hypothetical protein